jgi:guanine nucleotide-binding protein subunit alpha, other
MDESLVIFEEIANSLYFRQASIILLLNKLDLLQEKITSGLSPVGQYYTDFVGPLRDVPAAQKFFSDKFRRRYKRGGNQTELYVHFTTATDTSLLTKTMDSVDLIILRHNLTTQLL